ncbi:MAG TPA: hypothetical protein VMK65_07625 [Longimicrobiales bacterium]|nr:hypothetical protein [Longimicrobiales bacterium]
MKHSHVARCAFAVILLWLAVGPAAAAAQDTIPPARRDSLEEALARELERLRGDSAQIPLDVQREPPQAVGQGLNPDISAIGEILADLSPDEPRYTESGERFALSEVELAFQAVVDPYFRADFFIGIHEEVVEVEEAYLTALALPLGLQAKLGRFLLPMGKANLTHVPELHTVRHAAPVREFLGEEGLAAGGVQLSRIFAPLGFYQELQVAVFSGLDPAAGHGHGEEEEAHEEEAHEEEALDEPERGLEDQLAGLVHLKSFWDVTDAANVELGLSGAVGTMEVERETLVDGLPVHLLEREGRVLYGADLTVRWRPPARALYRSLYWSTEMLADRRAGETAWGGFSLVQWQVARRWFVGGRLDAVQLAVEAHEDEEHGHEEEGLPWRRSGAGYLTFLPSEFSRFKLALERSWGDAAPEEGLWRAVLQTTFALGPHRPHAF